MDTSKYRQNHKGVMRSRKLLIYIIKILIYQTLVYFIVKFEDFKIYLWPISGNLTKIIQKSQID